jgi:hypothetical protein
MDLLIDEYAEEMEMAGLTDVDDTAKQLAQIYSGLMLLRQAGYRLIAINMPFGIHPPHVPFVRNWIANVCDKIELFLLGEDAM